MGERGVARAVEVVQVEVVALVLERVDELVRERDLVRHRIGRGAAVDDTQGSRTRVVVARHLTLVDGGCGLAQVVLRAQEAEELVELLVGAAAALGVALVEVGEPLTPGLRGGDPLRPGQLAEAQGADPLDAPGDHSDGRRALRRRRRRARRRSPAPLGEGARRRQPREQDEADGQGRAHAHAA